MTINDLIAKLEQARSSFGNVEVRLQHEEYMDWVSELEVKELTLNEDGLDTSDMWPINAGQVNAVGICLS